jgi:hypothetical protein
MLVGIARRDFSSTTILFYFFKKKKKTYNILSYPDQNINCKQQVLLESAKHMILMGSFGWKYLKRKLWIFIFRFLVRCFLLFTSGILGASYTFNKTSLLLIKKRSYGSTITKTQTFVQETGLMTFNIIIQSCSM